MPTTISTIHPKKSKLMLPKNPTLAAYQTYVREMVQERGFENVTIEQSFLLFLEECGELAKAARKTIGMRTDKKSDEFHVDQEISDVFTYLVHFANHFNIDFEQAFRDKEEINKKRSWSR